MLKRFIPTVGAASLMICTGAFAQNDASRTTAGASSGAASDSQQQQSGSEGREGHQQMHQLLQSANTPDKLFIVAQAADNRAEIELAQLAQQKAENQQVKQVAQQIMQDHQKLGDQLKQVAQQENLQIPESMPLPPMKQQEKKVMESLSGQQFDQAYISGMKAAHAAAVSKYEDVSKTAQDGAVKQFASEALPSLQRHFQMINTAAQAVGLSACRQQRSRPGWCDAPGLVG